MHQPSARDSSYQHSLTVATSAESVFQALTQDLKAWWGSMDQVARKTGDVFTVSWGKPWYRFEVIVFDPPTTLIWKCIDANQIIEGLEGVQKEWVGTLLHWHIEEIEPEMCQVTLTHQGLVPDFICYDFCSVAWDHFIRERLKTYLEG